MLIWICVQRSERVHNNCSFARAKLNVAKLYVLVGIFTSKSKVIGGSDKITRSLKQRGL